MKRANEELKPFTGIPPAARKDVGCAPGSAAARLHRVPTVQKGTHDILCDPAPLARDVLTF